jgi:hypothetical protein
LKRALRVGKWNVQKWSRARKSVASVQLFEPQIAQMSADSDSEAYPYPYNP